MESRHRPKKVSWITKRGPPVRVAFVAKLRDGTTKRVVFTTTRRAEKRG